MTRFGITNSSGIGKLDLDSQNGTISNCILDIPQNIKVEFSGNTVTVKAGSVLVITNSTYTTATTTVDKSATFSDGKYYLIPTSNGTPTTWMQFSTIGSGSTLPADGSQFKRFFNTSDFQYYLWNNNAWEMWGNHTVAFPIGVIEVSNGVASFAKDSNGNDMIFNGAGFIGHHAFVYPNVKALIPDGFNEDGSMKSIGENENALRIVEIQGTRGFFAFSNATGGVVRRPSCFEVNNLDELYAKNLQGFYYVKSINQGYSWAGGLGALYPHIMVFIGFSYDGTTVTDFTIRQPVRMATVEMLSNGLAEKADQATTYTKTEVDASLALKANSSEVVTISGNQNITGTKNVYGTNFRITNNGQFKLLTYDTRIERGVAPSQWIGMFPYMLMDKDGKRLSGLYCGYATSMQNYIKLLAYKGTSTDSSDYATTGLRVGYDDNAEGYIRLENQTYDNPTSTTSDFVADVGFVNTRLNTRLQLVSVMPVSPNSETIYFVTTGQIYYGSTLIVDNSLESITGYDATATQTLKNVNGVLTWVTDV